MPVGIFCQCCLNKCDDQVNMSSPVNNQGILEVYEEMLQYSTGIQLLQDDTIHYICNICICKLRESCIFKNQVEETQSRLTITSFYSYNIKTERDFDNTSVKGFDFYSDTDNDNPNEVIETVEISKPVPKVSRMVKAESPCEKFDIGDNIKKSEKRQRKRSATQCSECPEQFKDYNLKHKHMVEVHGAEPKVFPCSTCSRTFSRSSIRSSHIRRVHLMEKNYSCSDCGKSFFTKTQLVQHATVHAKEQNLTFPSTSESLYTCKKCMSTFNNNEEYDLHTKSCITSFVCPHCGKTFQFKHRFQAHLIVHGEKVQCEVCNMFVTKYYLNRHMKQHSGKALYQCSKCPESFTQPHARQMHMVEVHGAEPQVFPCNSCPRTFSRGYYRNEHIRRVHLMEKRHFCSVCEKSFYDKTELNKHMVTHTGKISTPASTPEVPVFKCRRCKEKFSNNEDYELHIKFCDVSHVCPQCDKSYETHRRLVSHLKTHKERAQCEICAKFVPKYGLYAHKRLHRGELVHPCKECPERFKLYQQRQRHMVEVHGAEQQEYPCTYCSRIFTTSSLKWKHIRRDHLMERKHACTGCDKSFFEKSDLDKHMLVHTGEKKFECDVCHKCFGKKTALTEHLKIHHNIKDHKCHICGTAFIQKCSLIGHLKTHQ